MEPLWSPVVATVGNQRQIAQGPKPRKQAKSVATGCHPLPEKFHGKQGVCHGLPPVAGGPLPEREGVEPGRLAGDDLYGHIAASSCPGVHASAHNSSVVSFADAVQQMRLDFVRALFHGKA